jgi:hypothetical protein
VIREEVRGYGRATGRDSNATGDVIVTLDGDHSYPVEALSYLLEAFLHLEVDFLNASRFPVRDPRAMTFKAQVRQPGAVHRHVAAVLALGARLAVRHVGFPPQDSGRHAPRSDGMAFSEKSRSKPSRSQRPFRRNSIQYSSGWAK